ncbi:EpsG family protein [Gracilimonas sp. BCB1]|uniref:EpsG family protein n=1 Tax=Gracilimonas sp. BCB1 TaxID=3152362 RepID=UPI0032D9074B
MYILSATYYSVLLIISLYLIDLSKRAKGESRNLIQHTSIFFIIAFCGLRFFVGNDYDGYYRSFKHLLNYSPGLTEFYWEPGFYYLAKALTRFGEIGYFYLLLISSIVTFILIYIALKEQSSLKWGVYFAITLGLLIMANDQVRQGIALGVFLYSLKYIRDGELNKYLMCIIIASLFHYSSLLLVFVYFIRLIKLNKVWWIFLIGVTYVGFQRGIFYETIFSMIELIPYYGELYAARQRFFEVELGGSGLSILFRNALALIFIIALPNLKKNIYAKIYLTGLILGNMVVGFMPAERVTYYLYYVHIIALPLLLYANKKLSKQLFYVIVLLSFIFFSLQNLFALEKHGAIPYRTIFFEDLSNPPQELIYKNEVNEFR